MLQIYRLQSFSTAGCDSINMTKNNNKGSGGHELKINMIGTMTGTETSLLLLSPLNDTVADVVDIYISGYYALYLVDILCSDPNCNIHCQDNSIQSFTYTPSTINVYNCTVIDDRNTIAEDNVTVALLDALSNIDSIVSRMEDDCDALNGGLSFDIGYPLQADNKLVNINQYSPICCRGYRSCYRANSITSNLGSILCLASYSCVDTVIWNTDESSSQNTDTNTATDDTNEDTTSTGTGSVRMLTSSSDTTPNILCLANSACSQSVMKTGGDIYCTTPNACQNSVVLEAESIYCTMDACVDSTISAVNNVYLIDTQSGASIFSDNIGNMNVYVRGIDAGKDVTIYCSESDICSINCGVTYGELNLNLPKQDSCNELEVYCLGKCVFVCNQTVGVACPIVITSSEPSAAPSQAPSNAPTAIPTDSPTIAPTSGKQAALTEDDIEYTMQWTLLSMVIFSIIFISAGCLDARVFGNKNELFDFKAIVVFLFYTSDFVSDLFFCVKLWLLCLVTEHAFYWSLFVCAIVFIILPLIVNIYQLNNQIKKWNNENSDEKFQFKRHASQKLCHWINARIKFIYVLTFICGSSFSVFALCNSYLFRLRIFSMGLSQRQKALFRNQRIFSVVLLEVKSINIYSYYRVYGLRIFIHTLKKYVEYTTTGNSNSHINWFKYQNWD